jgi:murein DD-endopeptidase MepM/ murein hydrolase activator NlpD
MKQNYFILVVAHSLHGRLRRIHIPHQVIYAVLCLALVGCVTVFGFLSSYARMAWKVANYNSLKKEADALRTRYRNLQKVVNETNVQLASLQNLATEISVATGFKQKLEGPASISPEGRLVLTYSESLQEYYFLRSVSGFKRNYGQRFHVNVRPSMWPVNGVLMGPFGNRIDPFSGEGAHHTGIDISAPTGTVVRATGDGVVVHAEWSGGYGRLVIVDHGNGTQSYYAHLSKMSVLPGHEIRQNEIIGLVGSTGKVTAPHLHYEVRLGGIPVNPVKYLKPPAVLQAAASKDFPFWP